MAVGRKKLQGRGDSGGKDHKARMPLAGSRHGKKPRVTGAYEQGVEARI